MQRVIISAAMAISVLGGSVAPVRADFRLCNNSGSRVSVSLAYTDGETWVSEGWWNLKPSGCETLVRGALAAEYYYVYAMALDENNAPALSYSTGRVHVDEQADCRACRRGPAQS